MRSCYIIKHVNGQCLLIKEEHSSSGRFYFFRSLRVVTKLSKLVGSICLILEKWNEHENEQEHERIKEQKLLCDVIDVIQC